jgi:hypothetical protein
VPPLGRLISYPAMESLDLGKLLWARLLADDAVEE